MTRRLLATAAALLLGASGAGAAVAFSDGEPDVRTQTFQNVVTYTVPTVTETVEQPPAPPAREYGIASGGSIEFQSSSDRAREFDGYNQLGVQWARFDAKWSVIEAQKGVFDWSRLDATVADAQAHGLNVLLTITYAPAWANGGHSDDKFAPLNIYDYVRFAAAVVERYAPQGVKAYEVWNEPNLGCCFWKPEADPAKYAVMLREAYESMKIRDSQITVLGMALASAADDDKNRAPYTFAQKVYKNGGRLDALSVHPYLDNANNPTWIWEQWDFVGTGTWFGGCPSVRCAMILNGDGGKKVWATEVGQPVTSLAEEAVPLIFDKWATYAFAGPAFYYSYHGDDAYALTDESWQPRPAFFALQSYVESHP